MTTLQDLFKSIAKNLIQLPKLRPFWHAIFKALYDLDDCEDVPFGYDPKHGIIRIKPLDGSNKKYAWVQGNAWVFGTEAERDAAINALP